MSEIASRDCIRVNGQPAPLEAANLADLLVSRGLDLGGRGLAVAINGAVVPRAAWSQTELRAGDTVEIVSAKQGG